MGAPVDLRLAKTASSSRHLRSSRSPDRRRRPGRRAGCDGRRRAPATRQAARPASRSRRRRSADERNAPSLARGFTRGLKTVVPPLRAPGRTRRSTGGGTPRAPVWSLATPIATHAAAASGTYPSTSMPYRPLPRQAPALRRLHRPRARRHHLTLVVRHGPRPHIAADQVPVEGGGGDRAGRQMGRRIPRPPKRDEQREVADQVVPDVVKQSPHVGLSVVWTGGAVMDHRA